MLSGEELEAAISKKQSLLKEIEELGILLSCPQSLFLPRNETTRCLEEHYWLGQTKQNECYRRFNFAEPVRLLTSFQPNVVNEVRQMVAGWRSEARAEVARMTHHERYSFLSEMGYWNSGTLLAEGEDDEAEFTDIGRRRRRRRVGRPRKGSQASKRAESPGEDSSASPHSVTSRRTNDTLTVPHSATTTASGRKRKSTLIPRGGARVGKQARSTGPKRTHSKSSAAERKHTQDGDFPSKRHRTQSPGYAERSITYEDEEQSEGTAEGGYEQAHPGDEEEEDEDDVDDDEDEEDEEDEEEDEEEEDQLTAIVRRQREAFSARVAAGRPSIRNQTAPNQADLSRPLSGASSAAIARALQANKVLREWKVLARKVVCKVARQCLALRRDKITMAKRAARECARVVRQRALISHKAGKDATNRGHRLCREIATHWRNSTQSMANGNGPLTVNGITFPASSDSTGISNLLHCSDYGVSVKGDASGGLVGSEGGGTAVESAAAARRRAERAAAEQRRADLELLEARRQQRKLNFLITQTELYAHFMARKLDAVATSHTENPVIEPSGLDKTDDSANRWSGAPDAETEAAETTRILRRLEESDEELVADVRMDEPEESTLADCDDASQKPLASPPKPHGSVSIAVAAKAAATRLGISVEDEYDIERMKSEAVSKVRLAVERERDRRSQLQQLAPTRPSAPEPHRAPDLPVPTVQPPSLFKGSLKAYQLQGLNWLLGLFDQGINGILADEMGLGKTIQTIAFLGYLAETYNLWGPFLIVSPASTLHNWTQEFSRFLPAFRIVPYWGSPAERKVLRRFWFSTRQTGGSAGASTQEMADDDGSGGPVFDSGAGVGRGQPGTKDAEMHVVITSYQVVLQDAKFINKTAWSYIVLDEAHAIKSTSSLRWRILLSFKCRNRLLLTGTPIQNTMQELWALLHFIMPTLFDSHDEFANWFSRDIESQASVTAGSSSAGATGLSTSKLNENQLSRLHLILKPFMLRRIKTEVEHEISKKTEILRYCPLSNRQQMLYNRLRNKIRLEDLSSVIGSDNGMHTSGSGGLGPSNTSTTHLINLVMQLRKVCNHPDLWEPRDVRFSCISGAIHLTDGLNPGLVTSSSTGSGYWCMPRLFFDEGLLPAMCWLHSGMRAQLPGVNLPAWPIALLTHLSPDRLAIVVRLFAIFHPAHVHADLWHHDDHEPDLGPRLLLLSSCAGRAEDAPVISPPKCFSFSRLLGMTPQELCFAACAPGYVEMVEPGSVDTRQSTRRSVLHFQCTPTLSPLFQLVTIPNACLGEPVSIPMSDWGSVDVSNSSMEMRCHVLPRYLSSSVINKVCLQPPGMHVRTPHFSQRYSRMFSLKRIKSSVTKSTGLSTTASYGELEDFVRVPHLSRDLELVSLATRIADSGKLVALDALLNELKPAGHRVLIYSQMTRMIDILEVFMLYRNHAYLRLDGSSRLSDRRDMVAQWQTNPRWFVFLLSTRAGGLGINLTAADTVIFYDSDWNPTVDQQAMDRAHRLGQTKPVTVYRLVCKNTVEGRMMQRAEEKRAMQQMVIQSGQDGRSQTSNLIATTRGQEQLTSSDMVSLLLDDDELITRLQQRRRAQVPRGRPTKSSLGPSENEFGCTPSTPQNPTAPSTEINGSPMLVDTALERKRQALWAEMPRVPMGRPKKIRPIEPIGSAATAAFAQSSSNNNNTTTNNNNNNIGPSPGAR